MTPTPTVPAPAGLEEARDVNRFLEHYCKGYGAGAFAAPTAKEIAANPAMIHQWRRGDHRTVAVVRRLTRTSRRTDWTGRDYHLPDGALVVTHLARTPGCPVPCLDADYVIAYREDQELTGALRRAGRGIIAHRISAASEILATWGPAGDPVDIEYPPWDTVTVRPVPLGQTMSRQVPLDLRGPVLAELAEVWEWDDDFPYYSDGSWSAVSLRGFYPEDPRKGVKPAEMPRTWKEQHPADLERPCDWTVLADRAVALRALVDSVPWWDRLERVRLLRMEGRDGPARLGRHTDITDRACGTGDGQVVRFHIPLLTHPTVKLHYWDLDGGAHEVHLAPWRCYYLDARKPHAVTNPSGIDRVHLVVDVIADQAVRARLGAP